MSSLLLDVSPQPKIALFAPEVIDAILDHVVSSCKTRGVKGARKTPALIELESCSLVSPSWRGASQRRIFRRIVVRSNAQAERLIEGGFTASGLQEHVKELEIAYSDTIHDPSVEGWDETTSISRYNTLGLLLLFPNVTSFTFQPLNFARFQRLDIIAFRECPFFPQLSTLKIDHLGRRDDATLLYIILLFTPALKSLSVVEGKGGRIINPNTNPLVELPHLTHLSLGGQRGSSFPDLAVLSSTTLSKVTDLEWLEGFNGERNKLRPFLEVIGPTLKNLTYDVCCRDDIAADLHLCTALERVNPHQHWPGPEFRISVLPNTVHTLVLEEIDLMRVLPPDLAPPPTTLKRIIIESDFGRPHYEEDTDDPETLSVREMRDESLIWDFEELVFACRRAAIELVVKGPQMRQMLKRMT